MNNGIKFFVLIALAMLFISTQGCVSRVSSTVTTPNGSSNYEQTCVAGNCGRTTTQIVTPLVGTTGYTQCVENYRAVNTRAIVCESNPDTPMCRVLQRRMDGYRAWLDNPPAGTDPQTLMAIRTHFESTIGSMYREEPEVALTCTNLAPFMNGTMMAGFFGALGVGMGAPGFGYTPGMVGAMQTQRQQVLYNQ